MKKLISIILILSFFITNAQNNKEDTKPIMGIGGVGGVNFSSLSYSTGNYDYDRSLFVNPQFGLATEFYFGRILSIRPSILFAGRGELIKQDDMNYMLSSKNIDISIPILLAFSPESSVRPFIYIAPVYETTTGGVIGYGATNTEITKANHSASGFGITPAAGLKFFLSKKAYFSIEGGYHIGLSNTFSEQEISGTSNALNLSSYSLAGKRTNRAPMAMASFVIIINKKQKEEEIIPDVIADTHEKEPEDIVTKKDTVTDKEDNSEVAEKKENYTVKEIEDDIKEGVDVTNRKITFDNIEFEFNKTTLTNDSKVYLNEIVGFLKNNKKVKVQINGHTDNVGSSETNKELSVGRAKAVFDYLVSIGIEENRLLYKGFGDAIPIASNDTDKGRSKNRRVEFQIISVE